VHIAAPHPVPQSVVETRRIRRAQLFVNLDDLVFKTITYDRRLIIWPGTYIYLLRSYTHEHPLVLLWLAREIQRDVWADNRAERQTSQSQTA
jgi:hypothetical protein